MSARPLEDVRILAIEQFGAGPWGSLHLADLGADVIKVEDPRNGGDIGRYVPPYQDGEDSLYFETFNRNKRSISLDLRNPDGRTVLHHLVREVDAVYSNLRGDQPGKLGITYAQLRHVNPAIVCCSLSGYGQTGPLAAQPAYDYVIQGRAGWMSLTGEPDGPPTKSGLSLVDFCGGYVAALAVLAGIWRARREGSGCDCDVSLLETATSLLSYVGTWTASRGYAAARVSDSAHLSIVPFQNFLTADRWIVVACPKEHFWRSLCDALGRRDLLEDPRFATMTMRHANRESLIALLKEIFAARPAAEWLELLTAAGVPCSPVNEVAAALEDSQIRARDGVYEIPHPTLGTVRHVASPLRVGELPAPRRRGPFRGEHTRDVLRSVCGYDDARLAALARGGAFGDPAITGTDVGG
jgi:crotonobetainyl-CoA:carnitine CoA-transferase CaiB-like acyl-CoA transferase